MTFDFILGAIVGLNAGLLACLVIVIMRSNVSTGDPTLDGIVNPPKK